jgi:cell division septation protein DedD
VESQSKDTVEKDPGAAGKIIPTAPAKTVGTATGKPAAAGPGPQLGSAPPESSVDPKEKTPALAAVPKTPTPTPSAPAKPAAVSSGAPAAHAPQKPAAAGAQQYVVQVGCFKDAKNADELQKKLQKMGYPVVAKSQQHPSLGMLHVLQLVPVSDGAEAAKLMERVKKEASVQPILLRLPAE